MLSLFEKLEKDKNISMQQKGKIANWNTEKGFGFITPDIGVQQVFIHIKELKEQNITPKVGQIIVYELDKDKYGRTCAIKAFRPENISIKTRTNKPILPITALVLFSFFLLITTFLKQVPLEILSYYLFLSTITFFTYYIDKSAAKKNKQRISENTLHFYSLIGGWPGAVIAQKILHHKSKKISFRITLFITIVLNISGFIFFFICNFNISLVKSKLFFCTNILF